MGSTPTRVPELVAKHEDSIKKANSPSNSPSRPPASSRSLSPASSLPPPSMSGSGSLSGIKEDEVLKTTAPTPTPPAAADEGSEHAVPALDSEEEVVEDGPLSESALFPRPEDSSRAGEHHARAIDALKDKLSTLTDASKAVVEQNLDRIAAYPKDLPLSSAWVLMFSNTSEKNSSAVQWQQGQSEIFTASTVFELLGSLKAFKAKAHELPWMPKGKDIQGGQMGLSRKQENHNLHFFRQGIQPAWEDPWNDAGGRFTITPLTAVFESTYERLILLLAGSSLEATVTALGGDAVTADSEGFATGATASRRARGDRIELWLSGPKPRTPPPQEWLERFKTVLAEELEMPELKTTKYKKHHGK